MTVVSAATTSTTNITGFLISVRGSSLAKAAPIAGTHDLGIEQRRRPASACAALRFPWTMHSEVDSIRTASSRSIARCSTIGPSASAGKKVRPPMMRITPTSRPTNSAPWVGNVPADGGTVFFATSEPAIAIIGMIMKKRPTSIASAAGRVVEERVAGEAGEGRAVVAGLRGVEIEHLAEAVRAGIACCDRPNGSTTATAVKPSIDQRQDQDGEHRHLDLLRLDLLAEIFRRAADHQAGDEHRDDDEQQHAVEAGADAAEDDLAELHVDQRDHAAERREAVVHGVDGAVRGRGGRHRPQARIGDAEADLLAFHVGRIEPERGEVRIAARLRPSSRRRRRRGR